MNDTDKKVKEYLERAIVILNRDGKFNFGLASDIVVEVAKLIQREDNK